MRFYKIQIDDVNTGNPLIRVGADRSPWVFTSYVNGQVDPGALNVEMNIPVISYAMAQSGAYVRIWGISLQDVGQASNLNGQAIIVYGGMSQGLPLANPQQQGILAQGIVYQAFGNWQGTTQTLDIILRPSDGSQGQPKNLVVNWVSGQKLSDVIAQTLKAAYPAFKQTINISPKLVLNHNETGFHYSLTQFAQYLNEVSRSINPNPTYTGVDLVVQNNSFVVYDGTTQNTPKQINFVDLIGQPTWKAPSTINFTVVMRADLTVGMYIALPKTLITTTASSLSQFRQGSIFQGSFKITALLHNGNFRQPDGASWVTSVDAVIIPKSTTSG